MIRIQTLGVSGLQITNKEKGGRKDQNQRNLYIYYDEIPPHSIHHLTL